MTDLARLADALGAVLVNLRSQESILISPGRHSQIRELQAAAAHLHADTIVIDSETSQRVWHGAASIAARAIHLMLNEHEKL